MKSYRPDLAKSKPFITPAPGILCRATICSPDIVIIIYNSQTKAQLTVFVLVLKTRIDPVEVPTKICRPVGSNWATVMADL
jgi:hypothetical protein